MTNLELIQYIRTTMGDPAVDVELDNTQIQKGIDEALRIWNRRFPTEKLLKVQVTAGIQKYDLSGVSGLRGLVSAVPEPLSTDLVNAVEFDIFRDRVWAMPALDASDIALEDLYLNDLRIVTHTDFDWYFDDSESYIYLSPKPDRAYGLFVVYTVDATVEEATKKYDWVIEYALAHSKMILGHIRRKHGNKIPGKELDIQLDGSELVSEGKEEMKDLKENLLHLGPDLTAPIIG